MKHRSEFFKIYTAFRALVKTQYSTVIKYFRCDLDGIIHQTSCTYTFKQNGVAERKHRHIIETAHSLLLSASIPSEFWEKVVLTTVSLINTILFSHILGFSLFKKVIWYALDYFSFWFFCCTCFVLCSHVEHSKLSF